jgi:hypothetical protein
MDVAGRTGTGRMTGRLPMGGTVRGTAALALAMDIGSQFLQCATLRMLCSSRQLAECVPLEQAVAQEILAVVTSAGSWC